MGLNRMMMGKGGVKVEDGRKYWTWSDTNNKTISFTVPRGIKRIKVVAKVDYAEGAEFAYKDAYIKNKMNTKIWGIGSSEADEAGENISHIDIDEIVGVTPNKTYTLFFNCYYTSGVTFSWGKAINAMTPTVEDY